MAPLHNPQLRTGSLAAAASTISAATMINRILTLGREMILSKYFGAGCFTDAFNVACRAPNHLLRDFFAAGALSQAFVPTFIHVTTGKGRKEVWKPANRVVHGLLIILAGITLLPRLFGVEEETELGGIVMRFLGKLR